MKRKFIILVITLISIFCYNASVFASCTKEEAKEIQKKLDNIKISYEHIVGLTNSNNEIINGVFRVNISGLTEGLVFYNPERDIIFQGEGTGNYTLSGFINGNYEFRLYPYDTECDEPFRSVNIYFPKYNSYSDNYLCNDIDSTKFLPCNKWYEYDLDDKTFLSRLKEYKDNENKKNHSIISITAEGISNIFDSFIKYWYFYIVGLTIIVIVVYLIIKYYKNNNKDENDKFKIFKINKLNDKNNKINKIHTLDEINILNNNNNQINKKDKKENKKKTRK